MTELFNDIFNTLEQTYKEATKNMKNQILVNVIDNDEEYLVEAQVPGVKKEDIKINFTEGALTIEVLSKEDNKEENKPEYVLHERLDNFYKREIELDNVDTSNIKAHLEDGILTINVKKQKPESRTISIE